ncbi:DUF6879 family protein [Actinoallomurus sp. CA-150999]|uniref:DUF6879 family protein n=1 Tax=Actinoallomurus sp. CA-150999 TaxID=3239887 RepID=UPI003D8E1D48
MAPTSTAGEGPDSTRRVPDERVPFEDVLKGCQHSAVHLEMRDAYTPVDPWYQAWLTGDTEEFERRLTRPWLDLIREVTAKGVQVRRARIVSEPVSDYIRFEHATTASNVAAGEQVRWLPRRNASELCLPGNDFWVFDGEWVQFNHFTGDGAVAGPENRGDTAVVELCAAAFDAVWERAIPHEEYRLK